MRRTLLTVAALAVLATTAQAGNLFSQISGMSLDEQKTNAYTIDTIGINPRVYEFIPKSAPDHLCIAMFPNSDGKHGAAVPAMQCFKIKGK